MVVWGLASVFFTFTICPDAVGGGIPTVKVRGGGRSGLGGRGVVAVMTPVVL
jgi:hypothetical protein